MNRKLKHGFVALLTLFAVAALAPRVMLRAGPADSGTGEGAAYLERADKAVSVLTDLLRNPNRGIPRSVMDRAVAIAVVPHSANTAIRTEARGGSGLISMRAKSGSWSPPAFIDLAKERFVIQMGSDPTDVVLVFTDAHAVDLLLDSKLTLGADVPLATGRVLHGSNPGIDRGTASVAYAYSRTGRLFTAVALDGAVVTIDKGADREVYGDSVSDRDILLTQKVKATWVTAPFVNTLERFLPPAVRSAPSGTDSNSARIRP